VLARLQATAPTAPRPARRRTVLLVAAAAAVLGALAGGAVTDALRDRAEPDPPAATATLRTDEGRKVGAVAHDSLDGYDLLVLRVSDGPPGRHLWCRLRMANGSTRDAGDWVVPDSGTATWIAPAPDDGVAIELVTHNGEVWSTAQLTAVLR
jgi:hypothetical protein